VQWRIGCIFSFAMNSTSWNFLQIHWDPRDNVGHVVTMVREYFNHPLLFSSGYFDQLTQIEGTNIMEASRFYMDIPSLQPWHRAFVYDITMHEHRVKDKHIPLLSQRFDNLMQLCLYVVYTCTWLFRVFVKYSMSFRYSFMVKNKITPLGSKPVCIG
jgi:hypothetical protein